MKPARGPRPARRATSSARRRVALTGAPVGRGVASGGVENEAGPNREIGRHVVGPGAQHIPVLQQRGQHAGQVGLPARRGPHHHVGQARVEWQVVHGPAIRRDRALGVQRPEELQQAPALVEGSHRGRVEPAQGRWIGGAPGGQLQGQPGQVDGGDLGIDRAPARGVLDLATTAGRPRPGRAGRPGRPAGRPTLADDRNSVQPGHARCGRRSAGPRPTRRRPRSARRRR